MVAIFSKKLLAGEAGTINGDGRHVRDYVYGPDVAQANLIALTAQLPNVKPRTLTSLNIGTGIGTDVNLLEAMIRQHVARIRIASGRVSPLPEPLFGPSRAGDLRSNLLDAQLAQSILGWEPRVGLAEGIAQTVAWFAAH